LGLAMHGIIDDPSVEINEGVAVDAARFFFFIHLLLLHRWIMLLGGPSKNEEVPYFAARSVCAFGSSAEDRGQSYAAYRRCSRSYSQGIVLVKKFLCRSHCRIHELIPETRSIIAALRCSIAVAGMHIKTTLSCSCSLCSPAPRYRLLLLPCPALHAARSMSDLCK
jgi:hypothetical protein